MESLKNFIFTNFNFVVKLSMALFCLYWFFYFITPKARMSEEDKEKIESISKKIEELSKRQKIIDENIAHFEGSIDTIILKIDKINSTKIIIKEIYHEEINRVSNYTDAQIDSFFTARYGYYPSKNFSDTDR